jgi:gliding motility-associated-like protein
MWFQFAAVTPVVNITVNGTTLTQPMVTLLSSTGTCVSPFTELTCSNPGTSAATISYSALTTGTIYYIYIDGANNGVGTFNLCLNSPSQPQNDLMCNAITLPASNFCSPDNAYTNVGATQDMLINNTIYPGCWTDGLGANNGVWFKFVALGNQCDITVSGFTTPIINVVAPPANDCNSTDFANFIFRACNQSTSGITTTASSNSFVSGQTYYILVDGFNNTTGSFKICVNSYTPSATLINDACSGSIPLCPNSTITGTTQGGNPVNTTDPPVQWGTGGTGNNCNGDNNFTVYYDFWTDANNSPVTIEIFPNCTNPGIPGSTDNNRLQVGIFGFTNNTPCNRNNWTYLVCDAKNQNYGTSFTLSTTSAMTQPNTHYYIVFDSYPGLPCSFNLNINGNRGVNAGPDESVCFNSLPFNLTGFSPSSGGTWSGPGITDATLGSFSPTIAGIGKHVLFFSSGTCTDTKIVTVTGPTVNVSNNINLCAGQCATLIGDATQSNTVVTNLTFSSSGSPINIPDNSTTGASSTINVSGLSSSATISSVTININHTWNDDLDIYLVCPNGTQLELSTDNGGLGVNYQNVIFSPTASININSLAGVTTSPITGNFLPEAGSFSALNGCLTNGQWKLLVKDDAGGDIGTIVNWTISFSNPVTTIIPANFTWSPTTNMSNSTTLTPQVCPTATTTSSQTYTLTATDANGCIATDQVTVSTAPLSITASNDQTICPNGSATLVANGASSYSWASPNAGDLSSATGSSVTASPTVTTTYTVTGTSGTCTDTEEITVTVGASLSPNLTADTICANQTLSLTSDILNATSYSWTGPNGFTSSIQNPTINNAATAYSGTYSCTIVVNGCTGTATIDALVNQVPTLSAITSQTLCPFTNTNAITFSGTSGATFNWTNTNINTGLTTATGAGNIPSFVATNTTTATISSQVVVTPTLNGCNGTAQTFTITVSPPGTLSFTMDSLDLTCASANSGAITITPGGANYTYNWISGPTNYTLPVTNNQSGLTNLPEGEYCVEINSPNQPAGNTTIFTETFENGITNWTLNNTNGTNIWVNNNSYIGGTCASVGFTSSPTPDQPAGITNNPQSYYLHIVATNSLPVNCGAGSVNFPPLNANFNGSQASTQYATLNTPINTVGLSNVTVSFYWLGDGDANDYAILESSIDGGTTWVQAGAILNNQTTWIQTTRTSPTWANLANLRFRFKWINNSSSSQDPPIAIDQIVITADAPATCPAQATQCATLIAPPVNYPTFAQLDSICQGGTINLPTSSNNVTPITGTWLPAVNNQATTTYTFTPTAGQCAEDTIMEVAVKPIPELTAVASQTVCVGESVNAISYNSTVVGSTINWTNNTSSIGLSASGTGDINAFNGANPGNTPLTGTITATPRANGCDGLPITFSVTVDPIPVLTAITSQTVCAGQTVNGINFNSSVTGTTVNWTNTEPTIGLAASGNTDIASFTGINTGNTSLQGTITATPIANECDGLPQTFSITVNPIPVLTSVASQTVCAGQTVNGVTFSSSVSGSTIDWTNTEAGIGLSANGTGNISSFTGINNGTTPTIATLSAIPSANGCDGLAQTFSVTVNPNPTDIIAPSTNENCGQSDGTLNITNTIGGTAPFQYSFNGGTLTTVTTYNDLTAGTYTISVSDNNGCTYSKTITVGSLPGPTRIDLLPINANCGGSDGEITVTNTTYVNGQTPSPPFQYSFNGQPFTSNPTLSNIPSGNYTITVMDSNNCSIDSVISIGSNPGLNASFTVTTQLTGNDTIDIGSSTSGYDLTYLWNYSTLNDTLNAIYINNSTAGNGVTYNWTFNNGPTTNSVVTNDLNNLNQNTQGPGPIIVTLIASNGNQLCNDTAKVIIELKPFIYVPNVFSPNGDGQNDFFFINYRGYKNLNMIIFNRWGNKLFETSSPGVGWDGTGASEGTYYYIVTGVGNDDKKFEAKGYLTLVR